MNYKTDESHWVIDSGCTQHMTDDPRMFTSLDEEVDGEERITFGDNSNGKVQGLDKVAISNDHLISNVLYVASLSFNLLFVGQFCDLAFNVCLPRRKWLCQKKMMIKLYSRVLDTTTYI